MINTTYQVPAATTFQTVKTFTFEGPATAASVCMKWARLGCCLGETRVVVARPTEVSYQFGTAGGQHFQSGQATPTYAVRAAVSEVRLEARSLTAASGNLYCAGAEVAIRLCLTLSDWGSPTGTCVCDGTCNSAASYVDISLEA